MAKNNFELSSKIEIIKNFSSAFGCFMFRNFKGQQGVIDILNKNTAWVTVNHDMMEIPYNKMKVLTIESR